MSMLAPIVTLSLSPCLDLSASVSELLPATKLRCSDDRAAPGGGGLNVARVVTTLGEKSVAVAALGGPVGDMVEAALKREQVALRKIRVRAVTRENFAVTERSTGRQFRFVHDSHALLPSELHRCAEAIVALAESASCVVLSGSLPSGTPPDFYLGLAGRLMRPGLAVILDASGPALRAAMPGAFFCVKPSEHELISLAGRAPEGIEDTADAAAEVLAASAWRSMVVSMGERGALLLARDQDPVLFTAPSVPVVSTIGAGDSMVAGIAVSIARGAGLEDAVRLGVAAGSAAILNAGTGLCTEADVMRILPLVTERPLEREPRTADVTPR
jgi:6-phosphofructokinase 2